MGTHFHGTAKQRSAVRNKIVAAALLGHRNAPRIHYTQSGLRWQGIARHDRRYKGEYPNYADCSSFVTWCYWDGTLRYKPSDFLNGASWRAGYTGTQASNARGKWVATGLSNSRSASLQKADLVFYGGTRSVPGHVAIVVDPKRRLVVSHGSEGGPYLVKLDYRTDVIGVKRYIY